MEETINSKLGRENIKQVKEFRYLESIINDAIKCGKENKKIIAIVKKTFSRKIMLLCGSLDNKLTKNLGKCYVYEIWTIRKEEERKLEVFEDVSLEKNKVNNLGNKIKK